MALADTPVRSLPVTFISAAPVEPPLVPPPLVDPPLVAPPPVVPPLVVPPSVVPVSSPVVRSPPPPPDPSVALTVSLAALCTPGFCPHAAASSAKHANAISSGRLVLFTSHLQLSERTSAAAQRGGRRVER